MTERLFLEGKNFITVADAIVRSGYVHNHITRLCREGKLEGKKVGATWYVGEDSLEEFLSRPETLVEDGKRYILAAEAAKTVGYARDYVLELCREKRIDAKKVDDSWMVEENAIKHFFLEQQRMRLVRDSELAKARREARVQSASDQTRSALRSSAVVVAAPKELSQYRPRRRSSSGVKSAAVLAVVMCMLVGGYQITDAYRHGTLAMPTLPAADELLASAASTETRVADVVTPLWDFFGSLFSRTLSSTQDLADAFFGTSTTAHQQGMISVEITTSPAVVAPISPALTNTSLGVPIVQTVINQPVIERIRESVKTISVGGISEESLAASLQQLDNKLSSQIANVSASTGAVYQVAAQSSRIDQLSGTDLTNVTVHGVSGLTASDIPALSYFADTSIISIAYGGTGTSTAPTYGQMLLGNSLGGYDLVATSSLGISTSQWVTAGSDISYSTGNVGIGSTTPLYKLSVEGSSSLGNQAIAGYFTATSTTASQFPYASSTALTVSGTGYFGTASTTNLTISSIATGNLLKTTTAGSIIAAVAGTDYVTGAGLTAAYPFQVAGNATSTLTQFNGGLTAYASSTIGSGTQAGGLTISGGATTTGNAYFTGNVGIGTTTPFTKLEVNDEIISGAIKTTGGNFRMISGNYGSFLRNDGSSTYLLLTASGDQYGTWNTLRPFSVNDSTGAVSINTAGSGATTIGNASSVLTIDSTTLTYSSATKNVIQNNTASAWTIATSSTATPLLSIDTTTGSELVTIGKRGGSVQIGDSTTPTNLVFGGSSTISGSGLYTLTFGTTGDVIQYGVGIKPSTTNVFNLGASGSNWGCLYYNNSTLGTCASDERLKTGITDLSFDTATSSALDQLTGLRLRSFAYKSAPTSIYDGLIAQEVQAVAPELVVEDASTTMLAVKYGDIQWLTIAALQQLNAKFNALLESASSTNPTAGTSPFLSRPLEWFASATNGVGDFFASRVHTKELCVKKADGVDVCISGDQLAAVLAGQSVSASAGPAVSAGSASPVITVLGLNPAHIAVGSSYSDLGATVTDDKDMNLGISASVDGGATTTLDLIHVDTAIVGTYSILYSVTDNDGNTTTATRQVIVGEMATSPVSTSTPATDSATSTPVVDMATSTPSNISGQADSPQTATSTTP